MADDAKASGDQPPSTGSKLPLLVVGVVVIIALLAGGGVMLMKQGPSVEEEQPPAEYIVQGKMYQLKDGSYLKLAFSIVVDSDKVASVTSIVEEQSPGRLPAGITMILGNKSREDLINGTHKREAFARELKKVIEDRVFGEYNRKQTSARDTIEIREVLISDFVTQAG